MNHEVISELVAWIETQLNTKLTIDEVAVRSGYSKWYLQRTYQNSTGITLGEYIRRRRLSCAAAELRLTKTEVITIAMKYGFSSQQTFTRAFKSCFGQPPGRYRRGSEWDCSQLFPPYNKTLYPVGNPEIVSMPSRIVIATVNNFYCNLEKVESFNMELRYGFFRRHIRDCTDIPKKIWGISELHSYPERDGEVNIRYFTATEDSENTCLSKHRVQIKIPAGDYLKFYYSGKADEYQRFILDVNRVHLPKLGVVRRKGLDLELFSFSETKKRYLESSFINSCYYVPFSGFRPLETP